MNALVNLIIRVVLSLGFTIAMAVASNNRPNIVEFVLMWLLLHIAFTLYYYILKTQTSHIKNGICILKNQYFSSQNSNYTALCPYIRASCMYFGRR